MFEIKRKFLTRDGVPFAEAEKVEKITQGFMSTDPEKIIRICLVEEMMDEQSNTAYLTVKGKSKGISWHEVTTVASVNSARELLNLFCQDQIIERIRFTIRDVYSQVWNVDKFKTNHEGLIIAEIKLTSEGQEVILPAWIDVEITSDQRYSNLSLAKHPYPFDSILQS